jgi:Xaa-Pro dipeptidase
MTMVTGKQMVHEENIVITEDGAEYLSRRAPKEMPIIG